MLPQQDSDVVAGWLEGYHGSMRRQVVTVAAEGVEDNLLLSWETIAIEESAALSFCIFHNTVIVFFFFIQSAPPPAQVNIINV